MKKFLLLGVVVLVFSMVASANAYNFQDNFSTPWIGDYAPGWDNEGYRWGIEPVATMQQVTVAGRNAVNVSVVSVNQGWEWWGVVYNKNINTSAMDKQYNPYMKVSYYDDGGINRGGQLYAVPTTSYTPQADDWTDVQFGSRFNQAGSYYYHAAAPINNPAWTDTGVARTAGWHDLKIQLSSTDGMLHFYIDGAAVGTSERNDYTNLDTIMLGTMFQAPLSNWGDNKPYATFANVEVGSTSPVPIPGAL